MKISVVMLAKNAELTLARSLESLKSFDEVILYLNNSEDKSEEIARTYENVKVVKGEFFGFGTTKNRAASFARNDWVFSLDSDEIVSEQLIEELQELSFEYKDEVFILKRDNYFQDKKIKYSGWGKDYLARIYHKDTHHFNDNVVHEKILFNAESKKITLKNSFKHLAIIDISQFLSKINIYSKLAAADKKTCLFVVVLAKSFFAFFKTYFLRLGLLDGYQGFVIAISDANGRFYRYLQRYINCKK